MQTTSQDYSVDTLRILPAVGYIACQYKRQVYKSDSLSAYFLQMLKRAIPDSAKFVIDYSDNDSVLDIPDKEFLVQALPRFQKLNNTSFSLMEIGDNFEEILKHQDGRYFGFIYYEGFDQEMSAWGWGGGIQAGTSDVTVSFPGELVELFLKSGGPYLIINFLVVDKANDKFLYFNNKVFYQAPFNEKMIKRYLRKVCEEI